MSEETIICSNCQISNVSAAIFCASCSVELQNNVDNTENSLKIGDLPLEIDHLLGLVNILIAMIMILSVVLENLPIVNAIVISIGIWGILGGQIQFQRFVIILKQRKENLEMNDIID